MPCKGTLPEIITGDRSIGSGWFRKQPSSRKWSPKGKGKGKVRRVKIEMAFPSQEFYRGDPEGRQFLMTISPGWAVLDCGAAQSVTGAEFAAMLALACERRGRNAGDDHKVEDVEEKDHFRGVGKQVITSFIKLQVPGSRGK